MSQIDKYDRNRETFPFNYETHSHKFIDDKQWRAPRRALQYDTANDFFSVTIQAVDDELYRCYTDVLYKKPKHSKVFKFYDKLADNWFRGKKEFSGRIARELVYRERPMWLSNKKKSNHIFERESQDFRVTSLYEDKPNNRKFFHILDPNNQCLYLDRDGFAKFRDCQKNAYNGVRIKESDGTTWEWDMMELFVIEDLAC